MFHFQNEFLKGGAMTRIVLMVSVVVLGVASAGFSADEATSKPTSKPTTVPVVESATAPAPRTVKGWAKHHKTLVDLATKGDVDLYLEGDSITDFWERKFKENMLKNFGGWKPGDFGVSGDRTEHVLWRMENGELDHVKPKVIVLLIGTNNLKPRPDMMESTPVEAAQGVKAILDEMREKEPQAKILLMGVFPRVDTPLKAEVDATNELISKFDDGEHIKYLNINDKLLDAKGDLTREIMPDGLHPSEKGYQIWADAIRPTLVEWLGEPAATQPAQ